MSDFDDRLAVVLRDCVPGFQELVSASRLSGGASQETYCVEIAAGGEQRRLAVRRAPGGAGRGDSNYPGLDDEAHLIRTARAVGIPEPEIFRVFEPGDGLGEGFVMQWVEGETLGPRIVRSPELAGIRPRLARQCGEILARIHAIDLDASGLRQRLSEMTATEFVEQTWGRYKAFDTPQPMIDFTGRWLMENMPEPVEPKLVHNDFRCGNLMIDAERGVVAVLDWEIAHIGDPTRDLGWICTNSWRFGSDLPVGGFGQREDLFAGYEAVSGQAVDAERVKYWEVFGSFWWAVGCLGMAQHFRTGPDQSIERAAIGRRTSECQVDCVNLLIPGPVELVEPRTLDSQLDMPRIDELVGSVRDFLRSEVMPATEGRVSFLTRVSGNALDIVHRELALGPEHRQREHRRLRKLLGFDADLQELRWELVEALRSGEMELGWEGLAEHLRTTVVNQIAIDQPRYSGFKRAIEGAAV